MTKLNGMYNNIRQATIHKPVEMFLNFNAVSVPGETARSRFTFLAMVNNLTLTNMNGGKYKLMKISLNAMTEIITPLLELMCMTADGMSNIASRVSNLRLVTDVR